MTITKETSCYNQRRYGKPWIATVDFSDPKGKFNFGDWTGDHYNGGAGMLTISANVGDIVAAGQKDYRNTKYSAPDFYIVTVDGKLESIGDKGAAYKYYRDHRDSVDIDALTAERAKLMERIAEIDAIIKFWSPAHPRPEEVRNDCKN